ncbi:hypothetical protein V1525DRAFT_410479 [Lipomyces kononenkoae]|uniref:Uncharacterized protein n=1 Tax=Lipomyces kononenkoae TaxID=34357 RepID=A0ACC3SUF4_LIPKO
MDEEAILSFLTDNAQLSDILTRRQFIEIFPKDKRSDPAIASLYRDLSETRARQIRAVQKNIRLECAIRSRVPHESGSENADSARDLDGEDEIENIYSEIIPQREPRKLTLSEMIAYMEEAVSKLTAELEFTDQDSKRMITETGAIVDSLSDLRYKKLSSGSTEQCLAGLEYLSKLLSESNSIT